MAYFTCLADYDPELVAAADHKARWYEKMRERGLGVKLAIDDGDKAVGMIQYVPIECAAAVGPGSYMILCVWVHGHKKGVGDRRKHGIGTALLEAAEADVRARGAKGLAAWGLFLPIWMKASWFKKHGFQKVDRRGISNLMWKPFAADAVEPKWLPITDKRPSVEPGRVTITACLSGWCPAHNVVVERAKKVAARHGDRVSLDVIDTCDRDRVIEWGETDTLFVGERKITRGPPPSERSIEKVVTRELERCAR